MDNSTTALLISLVVSFILLSYFMTPDSGSNSRSRPRSPRPVTQDMITQVHQIAVGCTVDQIMYDLERTGSVDETIERYLNDGDLPHPPSEAPITTGVAINTGSISKVSGGGSKNKIAGSSKSTVGVDGGNEGGPFGGLSFEEKRKELVLRARARISEKEGINWD